MVNSLEDLSKFYAILGEALLTVLPKLPSGWPGGIKMELGLEAQHSGERYQLLFKKSEDFPSVKFSQLNLKR